MVYKVYSGRVGGVFGELITVEVDSSAGLPGIEIIGLAGSDVKEAKDRVRVALKNCGVSCPAGRVVINLSPADEHKEGAGFDLAIATGVMGTLGRIGGFDPESSLILGELSLDGKVLPVRGVLPIVRFAREHGFKRVIVPRKNAPEAGLIRDIEIIAVDSLTEYIRFLECSASAAGHEFPPFDRNSVPQGDSCRDIPDFADVAGQETVKRAVSVAAAGMHHLILIGPPGTGKSLIAKRIPGILPPLSYDESLEVTSVYSVSGKLDGKLPFMTERPFFGPHHGASPQAIVGGGYNAGPGLVSLSHRGILFLDEMPEFKRETLDMLRQPLEDGRITVSRARRTYTYPAEFMLVGAMNPCPCGYYPDRNRCNCTQPQITRYLSRISGPIMDRIDICVEVDRMDPKDMACGRGNNNTSAEMRQAVVAAMDRQKKRYVSERFKYNSLVPSSKAEEYIPLGADEKEFLYSMYEKMNLSMRSFYKIIRVARTIADLDGDETVSVRHLAEACCYRFPDYMGG